MNKHYRKGLRKEYKTRKQLLDDGFIIAQRSAGSHSPIDVFAIHREKRVIVFVQCKGDSMSPTALKKIEDGLEWLKGPFNVEFRVC